MAKQRKASRRARLAALVAVAGLTALAIGTAAYSDTTVVDGDGAVPVSTALNPLQLGNRCIGTSYEFFVPVAIRRGPESASDAGRTFGNSASLTLAVTADSGAGSDEVSETMTGTGTDNSIVLPSNWTTLAVDSMSTDIGTMKVSLTPTTPGAKSVSVNVTATGPNAATGAVITRSNNNGFKVIWTGVTCDTTPPVITPNVSGTLGNNGWYTSDVIVSWTVSDPESTVTSTTGCGATTINADTAGTTLTCTATSAGGTASSSVTIKRDATAPTLSPTVSPNPVLLNGSATASPNASDAMSGLASASCGPVVTSVVGFHSVSCSAEDNAGNTNTASANYQVVYEFDGFFQPVDNLPAFNVAKAGSAIPIKFSLSGDQGLNIFAAGYPKWTFVTCDPTGTTDGVEETATAGQSTLNYDPLADQYVYVWKSEKAWATKCVSLQVKLIDGTSHYANFKFTR